MIRLFTLTAAVWISTSLALANAEESWELKGDLAESCCCQKVCPCVFNEAPSLGHCEGSSLFQIDEGRYGDTRVDGLDVVFSYRFGEWVRVYVEDSATDDQVDAVVKLLNQASTFGAFFGGEAEVLSAEQAEISVEKTPTKIRFTAPDAEVVLEQVAGQDGTPVTIENLTIPWFVNGYAQYLTQTTRYDRDGVAFEYSGTNGATSRVEASGGD